MICNPRIGQRVVVPCGNLRNKTNEGDDRMTTKQHGRYNEVICQAMDSHNSAELAVGFIRYEALRKLNTRQFAELSARNRKGERFDDMVDWLITGAVK